MEATLLLADKPVTKSYRLTSNEFVKEGGYPKIRLWRRQSVSIADDVDALGDMLMSIPQTAALTLSVVAGDIPMDQPARRLTADRDGDKATLSPPSGCTCFVLDVDDWPLQEPFNTLDPREQLEQVRDAMGLGAYSCVWQLTSSARFGSMALKARLWFIVDSPLPMQTLKAAADVLGADGSVFNPGQIIYTAAPIFNGGADPIPNRFGVLLSDDDKIPSYLIHQIAEEADKKVRAGGYMGDTPDHPRMGFNQLLGYLGDGDGLLGFHPVLRRYTLQAVKRKIKRENIKSKCREAIAEAPRSPTRDKADIRRYQSDAYLDDLIDGAQSWLKSHDTLPPRHETDPPPLPVTLAEADQKIKQIARQFCERPEQTVLKVTVGAGKTTQVSKKIAEWMANNPEGNVVWFAPTHAQAVEVEERFNKLSPGSAIRIKGRLQQDAETDLTPCGRPDVIRVAQLRGLARHTKSLCCETIISKDEKFYCPLWHECQYYAQFRANHRIRILPHEYINHPTAAAFTWDSWRDNIALVVVDESPIDTIISTRSHKVDDVTRLGGPVAEAVQHVITGTLPDDVDALVEQIEQQISVEMVEEIPGVGASASEQSLISQFEEFKPNSSAKFAKFANILIAWLRGDRNSVWMGKEGHVHYSWKNKPLILDNALILDATAHRNIYQAGLGEAVKFTEINVEQNLYIIQVTDEIFSKSALKNPALVARLGGLATILNAGLITHKDAETQLFADFPDHQRPTAHFMALRGINAMENLRALVIAGRIEPPPLAIEAKARALWPRELLDFTNAYEWQRGDFGSVAGHSDPRIDAVLRDAREGEMAQAIGRLRAVRSGTTKLLIVATNAPCPLKPHQTITAGELLPDYRFAAVAIRDGLVIQSDKWLSTRHPDLFSTRKAAKRWTEQNLIKGPISLIDKLIHKGFGALKSVSFRVDGQRGSLAKAVTWLDEDTTRGKIEALTNKTVTAYITGDKHMTVATAHQPAAAMKWETPTFKIVLRDAIHPHIFARLQRNYGEIYAARHTGLDAIPAKFVIRLKEHNDYQARR